MSGGGIFPSVFSDAMVGLINVSAGGGQTFKMMLYPNSFTPLLTMSRRSELTEVTGSGYVAGGVTVTGITVARTMTSPWQVIVTIPQVSFPAMTVPSISGAVVYRDTGAAATSPLLCFGDFPEVSRTAATLDVGSMSFTGVFPNAILL